MIFALDSDQSVSFFNFLFSKRSVPLPKDVDHFKRERKLAINKSLQVLYLCMFVVVCMTFYATVILVIMYMKKITSLKITSAF